MDYTVHEILQARILEWVAFPFSRDFPNPGIQPRSPALQVDSLLAETQGKPKNTGVGSLSLLRGIFPTQESNWGLLHRRQILYQLNYQGNPILKLNSNILVKVKVKSLSRVQLFETPWTVAYQAPPSMEFSRQEYWSGLPFPSPEHLPNPGAEPRSPALQADALPSEPPGQP